MEFLLKPTTYARYRTYVLCELIPVFGKLRLAVAHRQQQQGRERVGDSQVRQTKEHE
ncbi:hypothetical protein OH807_31120 [Kitasatospora sp. NBC_01560]|uniref:hypothetical protein n=1 Tax=Kitasatospora sp. NBC_01560 TaxID=2975965 RepID=UPI003867969F